jgi:hypothetical protein
VWGMCRGSGGEERSRRRARRRERRAVGYEQWGRKRVREGEIWERRRGSYPVQPMRNEHLRVVDWLHAIFDLRPQTHSAKSFFAESWDFKNTWQRASLLSVEIKHSEKLFYFSFPSFSFSFFP